MMRNGELQVIEYSLIFPGHYDADHGEIESKGFFSGVILVTGRGRYRINFYEPVRLGQDIESEMQPGDPFFEPNLIVIPAVTRAHMERAIEWLMRTGQVSSLVPELAE